MFFRRKQLVYLNGNSLLMKKLLITVFSLVMQFAPTKAQWVTIADTNFVAKLTQLYPNCMRMNQMVTTCSQIVNATQISLSGSYITNLIGIKYFDNLIALNCSYNQLTGLHALPNSLINLYCNNNQINILSILPNSIKALHCYNNQWSSPPTLPVFFTTLCRKWYL